MVPSTTPTPVSWLVLVCAPAVDDTSISFAMPKSMILAWPSSVTMTLAGFRSRWTMPFSCARASPAAISAASSSTRAAGNLLRVSRSLSFSPRISSIAM